MTALLEVRGLNAFYGAFQALHGLDFGIEPGGILALLGANGAGKTTTLRALSGMIRTTGHIMFDGRPVSRLSTEAIARLGIAHVPEGRGTFARFTVAENLELGAITRRVPADVAADRDRALAHFPVLRERYRQQAGTLSGGEQQMLAIARALMLRPRLMLLDEPSFGLAPRIVADLFRILADINRTDGVALLIVEQNAGLALSIAHHACLIETGGLVMSGRAADIAADDGVRRAYLGA